MWYVCGSHREGYLAHGYAESQDGRAWENRRLFAPAEMRMFDFCVRPRGEMFYAVFSRIAGPGTPPDDAGLWWCRADWPIGDLAAWSEPEQIMDTEDHGWHSGPFKPSLAFDEENSTRAFVFFDGMYNTGAGGPFPFAFTLGCIELDLEGPA
jgi:hypothetical protein